MSWEIRRRIDEFADRQISRNLPWKLPILLIALMAVLISFPKGPSEKNIPYMVVREPGGTVRRLLVPDGPMICPTETLVENRICTKLVIEPVDPPGKPIVLRPGNRKVLLAGEFRIGAFDTPELARRLRSGGDSWQYVTVLK